MFKYRLHFPYDWNIHDILYNFLTQTSTNLSMCTLTMAWNIHVITQENTLPSEKYFNSDICFWVLHCSRVMYVYVYLGQFARDSPQCNQFCVNFIIWVHFRTGLFNFINFSPWMSTNKNEKFVALNDIYGMHLKAQSYINYARPQKHR